MEASEQIRRFTEFIETNYKGELSERVRKGIKFIVIDFRTFSKFDHELADELLDTIMNLKRI